MIKNKIFTKIRPQIANQGYFFIEQERYILLRDSVIKYYLKKADFFQISNKEGCF